MFFEINITTYKKDGIIMVGTIVYKKDDLYINVVITEKKNERGYNALGKHKHIFKGKETPVAMHWGWGTFGFYTPANRDDTLLEGSYLEKYFKITVSKSKLEGISDGDVLYLKYI